MPKFTVFFVDRKVPPRHPIQRLNRLVQFGAEWTNNAFPDFGYTKNLDARKARIIAKFERQADRMEENFMRTNPRTGQKACGFFDPNLPHGGPRHRRDTREDVSTSELNF